MNFWKDKHKLLLFFLFLTYVCYFLLTSFLRYNNFHTGKFDLGNMDQTVWNTVHGRFFQMSDANGVITSRLAHHADLALVFLSPLYLIWEDPRMLLLIQVLVVAAGAFFVYGIALEILKNKNIALVLSFAYLASPAIQRANLYDFHAVTLATTFILATFYFYLKENYKIFLLFALLSGLCKEEVWATISLFGLLLFFQKKKRLFGLTFFLFSAAMFYFFIWYLIPKVGAGEHFALSYFSSFGNSPGQVILNILTSPDKVIGILIQPDRIDYLIKLFFPLGFLSVLSPLYVVFALPDLVINLLSSRSLFRELYYHYTAVISPFIFISAIYSVNFLQRKIKNLNPKFITFYILSFSLIGAYLYGPLPTAKSQDVQMYTKIIPNQAFINNYLESIPEKYSIAATNNVGSHISEREKVYVLPEGLDKGDLVIFLRIREEERLLLRKIEKDPNYELVLQKGEFLVFKKKGIIYNPNLH